MKDQTVPHILEVHHLLEDVAMNCSWRWVCESVGTETREYLAFGKGPFWKSQVFFSVPEQSGQSLSRRNPLLSSAKDMIYLLQNTVGLQVITVYQAGELEVITTPEGIVLQDWGAEEAGDFCHGHQAKLSFSCTTILVHLFFCPSFGNVKGSWCGKGPFSKGRKNESKRAEAWRCMQSPLPMGSKRGGELIQQWEANI